MFLHFCKLEVELTFCMVVKYDKRNLWFIQHIEEIAMNFSNQHMAMMLELTLRRL